MSASTSVDLPAPGGPVTPIDVGAAGAGGRGGSSRPGSSGRAVLDQRHQAREREAIAGEHAIDQSRCDVSRHPRLR